MCPELVSLDLSPFRLDLSPPLGRQIISGQSPAEKNIRPPGENQAHRAKLQGSDLQLNVGYSAIQDLTNFSINSKSANKCITY